MNSNVQEITRKVNTLCDMIRDINIELTLQNQQLELVHHKVTDDRVCAIGLLIIIIIIIVETGCIYFQLLRVDFGSTTNQRALRFAV